MTAPICVAKGIDSIALKIREVAEAHDVPVVENPPLARALHATVEIDQEIPAEHYQAVAEVIGYVMRLKRRVRWGQAVTIPRFAIRESVLALDRRFAGTSRALICVRRMGNNAAQGRGARQHDNDWQAIEPGDVQKRSNGTAAAAGSAAGAR